ncbi:L-2-amino-thiazoline-4-carboxylic acid hydrolase [Bradyrhizobium cosmicum]|uniref:L-2-amino-thiazoline-4-carboxylic acid hydrolase n=1 Tax=Bradyrhizobium cosmicum TaxID=1404864 RepID=UPI000A0572F3
MVALLGCRATLASSDWPPPLAICNSRRPARSAGFLLDGEVRVTQSPTVPSATMGASLGSRSLAFCWSHRQFCGRGRVEGFGPDIKLTRTQTIMQGADHCDFRYRRDAGGGSR